MGGWEHACACMQHVFVGAESGFLCYEPRVTATTCWHKAEDVVSHRRSPGGGRLPVL